MMIANAIVTAVLIYFSIGLGAAIFIAAIGE